MNRPKRLWTLVVLGVAVLVFLIVSTAKGQVLEQDYHPPPRSSPALSPLTLPLFRPPVPEPPPPVDRPEVPDPPAPVQRPEVPPNPTITTGRNIPAPPAPVPRPRFCNPYRGPCPSL